MVPETSSGTAALTEALAAAGRGWRVIPLHRVLDTRGGGGDRGACDCAASAQCTRAGKHPYEKGWRETATTDPARIYAWAAQYPDCNWGVACGFDSNLLVLDLDVDTSHAEVPVETYRPRETLSDHQPPGAIARTGGGGLQLYYAHPTPSEAHDLGNEAKLLPHLDLRMQGGLVVLPGSVSGKGAYTWVEQPQRKLPPVSPRLMTRLRQAAVRQRRARQRQRERGEPVPEGQRNTTLLSFAGACWARGFSLEQVHAAVYDFNQKYCQPPLPDDEVDDIAARCETFERGTRPQSSSNSRAQQSAQDAGAAGGAFQEPSFDVPEERFTITGDGRRLAENYHHRVIFVPQWGWLHWNDAGLWQPDIANIAVSAAAEEMLRELRHYYLDGDQARQGTLFAQYGSDLVGMQQRLKSHIAHGFNHIKAIVENAQTKSQVVVQADEFDCDSLLLNTPSGVINLRGVTLDAKGRLVSSQVDVLPHAPQQRLAKQTTAEFDASATCPTWLKFLRTVFPVACPPHASHEERAAAERQQEQFLRFLQKAVGYSLTGDVREQVWFLLSGNGSNGKSVFLSTLRYVLGDYARPVDVAVLLEKGRPGGPEPELVQLVGRRFVTSQEPKETADGKRVHWDSARLKELTGGDAITIRTLFEKPFVFEPKFKLWVSVNHPPAISDMSHGTWRRIRLIPFRVKFIDELDRAKGEVGVPADKHLEAKLRAEASGILNWALEGVALWQPEGLGAVPDVIREATQEYRDAEDEYAPFFHDVLVPGHAFETVPLKDAWAAFETWRTEVTAADGGGFTTYVADNRALVKLARKHGYGKRPGAQRATLLTGCRLRTAAEQRQRQAGQPEGGERATVLSHQTEPSKTPPPSRVTVQAVPPAEFDVEPDPAPRSPAAGDGDGEGGAREGGEGEDGEDNRSSGAKSSETTVTSGKPYTESPATFTIFTRDDLHRAVETLLARPDQPVYLDTETTGLDPMEARVVSVQLSQEGGPLFIVDWRQADGSWGAELQRLFATVPVVGHHIAFDLAMLHARAGLDLHTVRVAFDTMLAEQVLLGGAPRQQTRLQAVAQRWAGRTLSKEQQTAFDGIKPGMASWTAPFTAEQLSYMCLDVAVLPAIRERQEAALVAAGQLGIARLEFAVVPALTLLRVTGVHVDTERWQRAALDAEARLAEAEQTATDLLAYPGATETLLNSPKQLREALAIHGVDVPNTKVETLEPLRAQHPEVDTLLEYRDLAKLVSTYGASALARVSAEDARLRADWQQIGTETGRMSCRQPNLQNLPPPVREAVTAAPGHLLLVADYSGMELWIAASLSDDPAMLGALQEGRDLHAETARAMFGLPASADVTAEYRNGTSYRAAAKALNFGLMYGETAWGISRKCGVDQQTAERWLGQHQQQFPVLWQWRTRVQEEALARGFSVTEGGRRRYYDVPMEEPGREATHEQQRAYFKARGSIARAACNHPVQGTGADILKEAIRLVWERLPQEAGRIVLAVHDELVVEVRSEHVETVQALLAQAMADAGHRFGVPLPEPVVNSTPYWTK